MLDLLWEPKKPTFEIGTSETSTYPTQKTKFATPPTAPKLKDVPNHSTSTNYAKWNEGHRNQNCKEPKAPELTLNKVHYVYQPNNCLRQDGKVLRNKEDGEKLCYYLQRLRGVRTGAITEAAHENEPRLAVPSCHGRR